MSGGFGQGVLDVGPQPPGPEAAPGRPPGPRPVTRGHRPRSTTSWFLLTCGKVLVAAGVGLAILIWLAYLGKLPDGLQNSVADGGESIGLDIPHAGETLFDGIPGSGRHETPLPPSIPIVSAPRFDPDDLVMDPPPVPEIRDIPPPAPPVEVPTYP